MGNSYLKNLLLAGISLIILLVTLYIPVKVETQEGMKSVWFGYPLPFINQSLNYNPPTFPRYYGLNSVWENPVKVDFVNAFLSFAIVFFAIYFIANIGKLKPLKS